MNPIDPDLATTLNYTFSTIAQTLAGLLGFLGAFVLFHYGQICKNLDDRLEQLISKFQENDPKAHELLVVGEYRNLLDYLVKMADRAHVTFQVRYLTALHLLESRDRVFWRIARALYWNLFTIVYSSLVLCFTQIIARERDTTIAILMLGMLLLLSCLATLAMMLRETLGFARRSVSIAQESKLTGQT